MSYNTYITNQVAKEIGMSAVTLNRTLVEKPVLYQQNGQWFLYSKYQAHGYTKTRTYTYTCRDDTVGTIIRTAWTEKGCAFIHHLISPVKEGCFV